MLALTFVRPGELRAAEWAEFDLDAGVWAIPAEKMKMRRPHRVPLAPRAVAILRELQGITGQGKFLFPSVRSAARCMSENTINAALRRLGFAQDEMTGHGFRSAASSMLNELGLWNADAIERQLAHVDNDSVRRAYARADFWEERVRMMAWWADVARKCGAAGLLFLCEREASGRFNFPVDPYRPNEQTAIYVLPFIENIGMAPPDQSASISGSGNIIVQARGSGVNVQIAADRPHLRLTRY